MPTKKWFGLRDLEKKHGPITLGLFLSAFREAEGLSQAEYAKKLGLSRANLCDIEKGRRIASPERAAKIAKAMGVPETALIQLALQDKLREVNLDYKVELKIA